MTVYIEYAVIDNFIINYLLIKTAVQCARVRTSKKRLLLSAFIGTVFAVLLPLVHVATPYLLAIKILLSLLMTYIAGNFISAKSYLFSLALFIAFTFLSGGLILAIFSLAGVEYSLYGSINYDSVLPVGITILLVYIATKFIYKIVSSVIKERDLRPFLRKCVIAVNGKKVITTGFIDSGNRLYDDKFKLPVVVLSTAIFDKVKALGLKESVTSVAVTTISGKTDLNLYVIDKLMIYNGEKMNIFNNVLIARAENGNFGEGFEVLLHPSLF